MLGRPMITDARGRRVPLVRHEALVPGLSDPQRRERLRRAGWHGGPQDFGRRTPLFIVMLAATMVVFALGPMLLLMYLGGPRMQLLTAFLPALVSVAGSIFWMRRLAPRAIVQVYLRGGLCASCGYDLAGVQPEEQVTTCPECGAAWSLPTAP
jgi:hypothetical protein